MTDADSLHNLAEDLSGAYRDGYISPATRMFHITLVKRIASLLDAVPPETLEAIKAGTMVVVPKEPSREIIDALYGPYLSLPAHETRLKAWREALALAAAPRKPEG